MKREKTPRSEFPGLARRRAWGGWRWRVGILRASKSWMSRRRTPLFLGSNDTSTFDRASKSWVLRCWILPLLADEPLSEHPSHRPPTALCGL